MTDSRVSFRRIFLVFLKIGAFAFGGVYSMLSFFERELVIRRKWLTHEEFAESVVIGQLTPGAPIVNTGIFIGYTLNRMKGALATTIGQVLPSFVFVLIIAYMYIQYREMTLFRAVLKGIGPAVVGLIASVIYNMSRTVLKGYMSILFSVVAFLCLAVLKANPIGVIIISAIAGVIFYGKGITNGNP